MLTDGPQGERKWWQGGPRIWSELWKEGGLGSEPGVEEFRDDGLTGETNEVLG